MPVWIDDAMDRIRIRPDGRPCEFTLSHIVLVLPDPSTDPKAKDGPGTTMRAAQGLARPQGAGAALR